MGRQSKTQNTVAQPLKYSQLRAQSQEELDKQEQAFQVEEAKQQLASDITATKRSLLKAEQNLLSSKRAYPFDSKAVVDAQIEVEGLQDGLDRLESLQSELF